MGATGGEGLRKDATEHVGETAGASDAGVADGGDDDIRGPGPLATGVVPVISVVLTTVRLPSSLPPMVALVTLMKSVPVIVTGVPPASGPLAGSRPLP